MKTGGLLVLVIALCVTPALCATRPDAELSDNAKAAIPDLVRRMGIKDASIREGLFWDLAAVALGELQPASRREALTDNDYAVILRHALRGQAARLPIDRAKRVLGAVKAIAEERELPGVDECVMEFVELDAEGPAPGEAGRTCRRVEPYGPRLCELAVDVLVTLRSPKATPFLIAKLISGERSHMHRAMEGVTTVRGVEAAPYVRELLDHEDENIRIHATRTLYELDARQYGDDLYDVFIANRSWREMDTFVLAVLVKWEDERVTPFVMQWLTEKGSSTRNRMASRLVDVNATPIADELILLVAARIGHRERGGATGVVDAMRLLGRLEVMEAIPVFRQLVRDDSWISSWAAEQLGVLRAREAVPDLVAMLEQYHPDDWHAATHALARIGSVEAAAAVIDAIERFPTKTDERELLKRMIPASAPRTCEQLQTIELEEGPDGAIDEYFAQFEDLFGVKVSIGDSVAQEDRQRRVAGRRRLTGMQALDVGMGMLNYGDTDYACFMEEGHIHILPVAEVLARWKIWIETQKQEQ
jgi:hypothetical protein